MELLDCETKRMEGARVEIGSVVRFFREKHGLSQESLADLSGLSRNHVSDIERNVAVPTVDALYKLSVGLNIRLSDLILEWEKHAETQ